MEREDVRVALAAIGTRSDADIALEKKEPYQLLLFSADLSNLNLRRPNPDRSESERCKPNQYILGLGEPDQCEPFRSESDRDGSLPNERPHPRSTR